MCTGQVAAENRKERAQAESITCKADLAGALVGVLAEHVAGASILTGG